jgi:hypothetical protein
MRIAIISQYANPKYVSMPNTYDASNSFQVPQEPFVQVKVPIKSNIIALQNM